MGKLSDEIMADLGKKSRGGSADKGDSEGMDDPAADEGEESSYASDEVAAMQDFEDATSPEEKASALKAFLEACGVATKQ